MKDTEYQVVDIYISINPKIGDNVVKGDSDTILTEIDGKEL